MDPSPVVHTWILVPADQPGLEHRARRVVRRAERQVLLRTHPGANPPGTSVGIGFEYRWSSPQVGFVAWFGDLSAVEVGLLETWLAGEPVDLDGLPAPLEARITASSGARVPDGPPSPAGR
ncbi:hypothetical protein AB2L28_07385 [Kineococcus sp. TBRC 1896]|uniref:Uncharacterized protein n=1 Tax=Kineococcus mangrovi TaxID=1660183 RepID=A0ABV4I4C4_9ACTN